jgi:hypothetical protein
MLENRPFDLKGPAKLTEIRQKINELECKRNIDQVQFDNLCVNIYVNAKIDDKCIEKLNTILSDYEVKIYGQ